MIEIIPNWHPIFVHFTFALFTVACGFYLLAYLCNFLRIVPIKWVSDFEITGRWCLWSVALITIGTVLAGLYAYNTVKHDEAGHVAMTLHRNWALTTATGIIFLAIWSGFRHYKSQKVSIIFIIALFIVQASLIKTAFLGGELVFRHGLGVMSLPKEDEMSHHHHHSDEGMFPSLEHSAMPSMENHEHTGM